MKYSVPTGKACDGCVYPGVTAHACEAAKRIEVAAADLTPSQIEWLQDEDPDAWERAEEEILELADRRFEMAVAS